MAIFPSAAAAAPVVVLGLHGHAVKRNDPFLTGPALTPAPNSGPRHPVPAPAPSPVQANARRRKPQVTVRSELMKLVRRGQLSLTAANSYNASFNRALASERRLHGQRRVELAAVTENLHQIAAQGSLTASRLPVLFDTLARNREWWTTGPLLSSGERVEFSDSQLVWQYYPGQGIELQVLGTFGKADGLYTAGSSQYPALQALLAEMIPLAAQRGGGLTWEYYFHFDGGRPPWTSAMSQATGLEALSRAFLATGDSNYLDVAARALPIFTVLPPVGVNVPTQLGTRYLQYSFARNTSIINAFLQTLIGLYDYAKVSGSAVAQRLFTAGNAEAIAEVPQFDTGAWSLYQPGVEDPLSYHQLVTGFLQQLCARTAAPVYCTTAAHFQDYLRTPPALSLLSRRARVRKPTRISFSLSKVSHVGIVVLTGTRIVFSTSATFGHGLRSFAIPSLKRAGSYTVRLAATDLAGNFNRVQGTLAVRR